jgi:hypothetical protein
MANAQGMLAILPSASRYKDKMRTNVILSKISLRGKEATFITAHMLAEWYTFKKNRCEERGNYLWKSTSRLSLSRHEGSVQLWGV